MQLADTLAAHYTKFEDRSLISEIDSLKTLVLELKKDSSRDVKQSLSCIPERVLTLTQTSTESIAEVEPE